MSSESNGDKPDSVAAGPPSGVTNRTSGGRRRRGARCGTRLRRSTTSKPCFEARASRAGRSSICSPSCARAQECCARPSSARSARRWRRRTSASMAARPSTDSTRCSTRSAAVPDDRPVHADQVGAFADELEASADLLALLDRASAPVATEVSLNLVAREAGRMSGTARGHEMVIQFDEANPDCVVTTDPYVLGPDPVAAGRRRARDGRPRAGRAGAVERRSRSSSSRPPSSRTRRHPPCRCASRRGCPRLRSRCAGSPSRSAPPWISTAGAARSSSAA